LGVIESGGIDGYDNGDSLVLGNYRRSSIERTCATAFGSARGAIS